MRRPFVTLKQLEAEYIQEVLDASETLTAAAQTLGINMSTLWRKRERYNLKFTGQIR